MEFPTQSAAGPARELAAYLEYLRDLGIYDLYRREQPDVVLSAAARDELLCAAAAVGTPASRTGTLTAANSVRAAGAGEAATGGAGPTPRQGRKPASQGTVTISPVRPPSSSPAAARVPLSAPSAPKTYFDTEPSSPDLPPELAAPMPKPVPFDELAPLPAQAVPAAERAAALEALRAEIGDCTRCPLAYAGRHTIVFADGDPNARLMFVGEGPGADEDATGVPFVGKAGQLLNNMITAMGTRREEVFIANIVKCRPPGNRTPEFVEATTCSQFLLRQIDIVRPQVIVALGATAATYLLGVRQSLASLRGQWHSSRGARLLVTYHPAYLLRDPRQKGEAWKDLQMAMAELGLKGSPRDS